MKWYLFFLLFCCLAQADIYITVSGANVRRAKMAVGNVHPDGGGGDAALARKVHDQVKLDLEFMNLFEFINPSLVAQHDSSKEISNIRYDDFVNLQASFALKMGYKINGGTLFLEATLHDVSGRKKIFNKRYNAPSGQYVKLIHTLSEDILREVTGERGLFTSKILMSCRELRRRQNPPKDIYVMDADGRNIKQLTNDETISLSPSWSPDGKTILYTQYEFLNVNGIRQKGTVLKRHELSSGSRKRLSSKSGMNSGAAWSPDGRRIAVTLSYTDRPEIYFISADGGGDPEPLSRNIQWRKMAGDGYQSNAVSLLFEVEPKWSPDGKKIVFSSRRTGQAMVYTVDLATKAATQLTFAGQYNSSPAWSPKGDKILFAAQRLAEGNFDIYSIDPDGNNLARVTVGDRNGGRKVNSENPSWAPTGRHFAYGSNEGGHYSIFISSVDGNVKRKISPNDKDCSSPSWGPVED